MAQEIYRRQCLSGKDVPELLMHFQSSKNEIDFVLDQNNFIEVNLGNSSAMEFKWFNNLFPKSSLTVINKNSFETSNIRGITIQDWLVE